MNKYLKMVAILLALSAPAMLWAQEEADEAPAEITLRVGDAAPQLQARKWLGGDPVEKFEGDKIYVIDFWASWCAPCLQAMPHLSKLNTQFKDKGVVIIAMNMEVPKMQKKEEEALKTLGDKVNFRVAFDAYPPGGSMNGLTWNDWMDAAGRNGIPCTFVVNREGKIAWIGHPTDGLDMVLQKLVAGTFDAKTFDAEKRQRALLQKQIVKAFEAKEWDKGFALMDKLAEQAPELKAQSEMGKAGILILQVGDYDKGYALADKMHNNSQMKDPAQLNSIAYRILVDEGVKQRNVKVALKLAKRADDLSGHKDPHILDTLGLAYFENGDRTKAVETQKLAVKLAAESCGEECQKATKKQLEKFESAEQQEKK